MTPAELAPDVRVLVTDRYGGTSRPPFAELNLGVRVGDAAEAVAANRRRVAEAIGLGVDRVVYMHQVHGADVARVTGPGEEPGEVDALVTDTAGIALAVLVADCVPVLLADPGAGVAGAAHAGRAGTAAGVVPALVDAMRRCGAAPERIRAHLGPAVCGGCYEVPARLREEVAAAVPEAYATTRAGTPSLDLRAGIAAQLRAAGVTAVRRDPRCTVESAELYSYRRDGRTGRFAGIVWIGGYRR